MKILFFLILLFLPVIAQASVPVLGYPSGQPTIVCTPSDSNSKCAASGGSQWTTSGNNIYYNNGNVGIGTGATSPSDVLQVNAGVGGETINYVAGSYSIVQSSSNANNFAVGNIGGTNYSAGQSIVFSTSVTISAISLTTTVASGSPAQITASIQTNSAGQPSGTLANANATKTFTPNNGTVTNISYTPFTIPAGTYWIVVSASSGSNSWYDINYNTTNPYSPGSFGQYNGATWSISPSEALQFTVTAITSSGSPTLTFSNGGTTLAQIQVTSSNSNLLLINSGNVGIGTSSPAGILDVTSTTSAFLPPRMTTTQKNAIGSPSAGMVVYDTTLNALSTYNGSSWTSTGGGSGLTVGTTTIANGTNGYVEYNNNGVLGEEAVSGTVTSVSNSDGTLTISPTSGSVVASLALGHANTWTGTQTISAANLATDTTTGMEVGTATSQKLGFFGSTPIAQPSGDVLTNLAASKLGLVASPTIAQADVTSLVASGKTFTANNSITIAGTDSTTMTFPSSSATLAGLSIVQTWTGTQKFAIANHTEETFSTASSVTPTGSYQITVMNNTQGAATFTVNNPTNNGVADHQVWCLQIDSSAVQTFSWGTNFNGGILGLPAATLGTSVWQNFYFYWNSTLSEWVYQGQS